MRVTNNITTRQFLANNNRLLTRRLQSENRIATQRRFNRVSEDVINGSKAMIIRRQLRDLAIYNDNLGSAKAIFNAAETNLTSIAHDNYISVEERLVASSTGTYSQEELDIFATELDEIADEMVKTLNADFSERQLFGGASNQKAPFRIERVMIKDQNDQVVFPPDYNKYFNADGSMKSDVKLSDIPRTVTYNGIPLDFDVTSDIILPDGTLSKASGSYTVTVFDEQTKKWKTDAKDVREISEEAVNRAQDEKDNSVLYPGSKPIYIDIGLGIKYNDDLTVDPQTALDIAINGAKTTGCGIDIGETELSKSVTTQVPDSQVQMLKKGCPPNTDYTVHININGTGIGSGLNLGAYIPTRNDGKEYSDEEITEAFNKALKEKYELNSKEALPEGVKFVYKEPQLTFEAGDANVRFSDCAATPTCFYFPTGDVNQDRIPMGDDGAPDLSNVFSKNLMQLVIDAASALRKGDQARVNAIIDRANEANNHILTEITTLGTKYNSIEFYQNKNKDYDFNLKERQNLVEGTDMENEIIEYEAVKAAYDATLKMGTQILPHSIFDFI